MKWFIIAVVYFTDAPDKVTFMDSKPFETREKCMHFYQNNIGVRNDVLKMYPDQRGHSLFCIDNNKLNEVRGVTQA